VRPIQREIVKRPLIIVCVFSVIMKQEVLPVVKRQPNQVKKVCECVHFIIVVFHVHRTILSLNLSLAVVFICHSFICSTAFNWILQ